MGFSDLSEKQQTLIKAYLEAVIEANQTINLTRITSYTEAFLLHIEDSLSALPEINHSPSGLYGDLGTGGGFPGVPLAVATGRETLLIDMRQKKMATVSAILESLSLNSFIHTYSGRAELLARTMPCAFSVLTARALAQLPVLLELASPLLKRDGVLICYKSHVGDEELQNAKRVSDIVGMNLIGDRSFKLEDLLNQPSSEAKNAYYRRILTFHKVAQPKIKLPRQEGTAQKNPL